MLFLGCRNPARSRGRHSAIRRVRPVAAALLLAGLLAACSGDVTDQSGPLTVGTSAEVPENTYCAPLDPRAGTIGLGDVVSNPGEDPAELRSIELVQPRNLELVDTGAWTLGGSLGLMYHWSEAQAAGDVDTAHLTGALSPASGYVVEPGATVGVAALVDIEDPSRAAGAYQLMVRYEVNGKRYAEMTNLSYEMEPDGCD